MAALGLDALGQSGQEFLQRQLSAGESPAFFSEFSVDVGARNPFYVTKEERKKEREERGPSSRGGVLPLVESFDIEPFPDFSAK